MNYIPIPITSPTCPECGKPEKIERICAYCGYRYKINTDDDGIPIWLMLIFVLAIVLGSIWVMFTIVGWMHGEETLLETLDNQWQWLNDWIAGG